MNNQVISKLVNELTPLILKLYYYDDLICPNCLRKVPNKDFFRERGCCWCVPKEKTKYWNYCGEDK